MLPPHLQPSSDKIKALEDLRRRFELPHEIMIQGIAVSKWAVIEAQKATLENFKKQASKGTSERDLLKSVLLSRLRTKLMFPPGPFDQSPDEIQSLIGNIDAIMDNIRTFDELLDYVLKLDAGHFGFDPSGIQAKVNAILESQLQPE